MNLKSWLFAALGGIRPHMMENTLQLLSCWWHITDAWWSRVTIIYHSSNMIPLKKRDGGDNNSCVTGFFTQAIVHHMYMQRTSYPTKIRTKVKNNIGLFSKYEQKHMSARCLAAWIGFLFKYTFWGWFFRINSETARKPS